MQTDLIVTVSKFYFTTLEVFILIDTILCWVPFLKKGKRVFEVLSAPLLIPLREMQKISIYQIRGVDFAPIFAFIILECLKNLFTYA